MSAATTRSSFERRSWSRYWDSSAGRYWAPTLEVSQRWYLAMSNWLSVWNSGMFRSSAGGELRIAWTISSAVTLIPRRRYSDSSI